MQRDLRKTKNGYTFLQNGLESASHCVETGSYGQEQEIPTATLDGGEGADVMPGLYELNGSRFLYKTNGLLKMVPSVTTVVRNYDTKSPCSIYMLLRPSYVPPSNIWATVRLDKKKNNKAEGEVV